MGFLGFNPRFLAGGLFCAQTVIRRPPGRPRVLLGAHVSIAGGVENAPDHAKTLGCDVFQMFSKNQQQWKAKPLTPEGVAAFQERMAKHALGPPLVHASYLLNLASPDEELWKKSVEGLLVEVERADALGVPWVVFHPGAAKEMGPKWGVKRIAEGVNHVLSVTKGMKTGILYETNAGAGSAIGRSFEELAEMLDLSQDKKRTAVCVDTCHIFVAGYAIHTADGYAKTFEQFDDLIGLDELKCFHLNDAKAPFGSNKDRHEHIGKGLLGMETWKRLMTDPRFATTPGYLETEPDGHAADLAALRKAAGRKR